jgi:Spy/CpxP family protein refolding chaperone
MEGDPMKQIRLLTFLATFLFALAAVAQQNPPAQGSGQHKHGQMGHGMGDVDEHVKELSTKLDLTADQQSKVKAILQENQQQMQAMMKDQSMSKDDMHAKMQSMHDSVHTKIREVLNADQKKKFDALVDEHMHGQHGKDHDHHQ